MAVAAMGSAVTAKRMAAVAMALAAAAKGIAAVAIALAVAANRPKPGLDRQAAASAPGVGARVSFWLRENSGARRGPSLQPVLDCLLELGEEHLHDLPYTRQTDSEIVVDQNVAETGDSSPIDLGPGGPQRLGQPLGGTRLASGGFARRRPESCDPQKTPLFLRQRTLRSAPGSR